MYCNACVVLLRIATCSCTELFICVAVHAALRAMLGYAAKGKHTQGKGGQSRLYRRTHSLPFSLLLLLLFVLLLLHIASACCTQDATVLAAVFFGGGRAETCCSPTRNQLLDMISTARRGTDRQQHTFFLLKRKETVYKKKGKEAGARRSTTEGALPSATGMQKYSTSIQCRICGGSLHIRRITTEHTSLDPSLTYLDANAK